MPWRADAFVTTSEGTQLSLDDISDVQEALAIYDALGLAERNSIALTQAEYEALSSSKKGAVSDDLLGWSRWSPPYSIGDDALGTPILSPGPRRYFQIKAEFSSDELQSARLLGALSFTASNPPIAERIISEVVPRQVDLGVPVSFTYAVLPTKIRSGVDQGFDVFEIATPVRCEEVGLIEVIHADGRVELADFSGVDLESLPVQDDTGQFAVEAVEERLLRVRFPMIDESDLDAERAALLKIGFTCRVLRFGTTFSGTARNGATTDLGQRVIGGNAADLGAVDDDITPIGVADPNDLAVKVLSVAAN